MLTLKNIRGSKPIARISGGKNDGKYVRLVDDSDNYSSDSEEEFNVSDIITEDFLRSLRKKKLRAEDIEDIYDHYAYGSEAPEGLDDVIEKTNKVFNDRKKKEIVIHDGTLIPVPDKKLDREVNYIAGPSGSGKSTYVSKYAEEYKKMYPKNDITVFSRLAKDKAIDKLKPQRVMIDEELLEDPIDAQEELADSCCIFDDIDTIRNKELREAVQETRDDILETGRHAKITCLCTSHQLMNYSKTRTLLNESTSCTFFPKSGSTYHIKRFLKEYCGLDRKDIQKILNLPSRWVMIHKSYPQYVVYQQGAYLLK